MKKCGRCGNKLKERDRFCSECGTPLPVRDNNYSDRPDGGSNGESQQEYFGR